MKKTLVVMMAFVLGLAVMSCKQGPKAEATEADAAVDPIQGLTELVEKAKADGANWSVDEWKDVCKTGFGYAAPVMKEMLDLYKSLESKDGKEPDAAKVAELMSKGEEIEAKMKPFEGLLTQLDSIAKLTPNGKAVMDDKEFEKEIWKEFGLEELK